MKTAESLCSPCPGNEKLHIEKGLAKNNNEFGRVLGSKASKQVMDMIIICCFNMDGMDPTGRKVGLLDRHHLWAFLVDPLYHLLRSTFLLVPQMAVLVQEMIEAYIPVDEDGSNATRERVTEEFMVCALIELINALTVFDSLTIFIH